LRAGLPVLALASALAGCQSALTALPGTQPSMDFTRGSGFYAAPFPSDDLITADGHVDVSGFPNPLNVSLVAQGVSLVGRDGRGFAQSAGVFFALSDDLDATKLPSLESTVTPDSSVFLIGVQSDAPDYLHRYPVEVNFEPDGGPFGAKHMLSLLPLQGIPLRPATLYAAVVLRGLLDANGHRLGRSAGMASILNGKAPKGLGSTAFAHYRQALQALGRAGVESAEISGLAVFTTDDSARQMGTVVADMLTRTLPSPAPFMAQEVFDGYCVFASTVQMPDYQRGTPPFAGAGGDWVFDANGNPIFQRYETANLFVTIPRTPMPAAGYPVVLLIHTGFGELRPLVDRGQEAATGGPAIVPGSGPGQEFAKVGWAGMSVDGPLDGLRNTTNANEDYTIFNFLNPPALRDNIRESGAELALFTHAMEKISLDVSTCPGASGTNGSTTATFDVSKLVLFGHSMGATIAPLALASDPRFKGVILSGSGASLIENLMYKLQPFSVKPFVEAFLNYPVGTLKEDDPILSLIQFIAEPSDSQIYERAVVQEPPPGFTARQVLMLQGIVDNYIRPRIANASSLALGLDLAGPELDMNNPAYTSVDTPIGTLLWASGRHAITLAASANFASRPAAVTAIVTQDPGDGIEDGHEMVFQTEPPKNQYRCFLKSFAATGLPSVPPASATGCD
jgi:hypothetical protein